MYNQTITQLRTALSLCSAQFEEITRKFGEKYIPEKLKNNIANLTLCIDNYEAKQREIDNTMAYAKEVLSKAHLKEIPGGKWSVSTDPAIICRAESHADGELLRFEIYYIKKDNSYYLLETITITPRMDSKAVIKTAEDLNEVLDDDYVVEAEYNCLHDRLTETLSNEGYEF